MPWLLWCFARQSWPHKELVIVDSSTAPSPLPQRPELRVIPMPVGTSVPDKRNRALAAARGEIVAWFDDDDWQHPERLSDLVPLLSSGREATCAGPRASWLLDLGELEAWRFPELEDGVLFNGSAFRGSFARQYAFDPRRRRASDTVWMAQLLRASVRAPVVARANFFWLFHGSNLSVHPRRRARVAATFAGPFALSELRSSVGGDAWGDTDDQLAALRARLTAERAEAGRTPT